MALVYRARPVVVEAMQVTDSNCPAIVEWVQANEGQATFDGWGLGIDDAGNDTLYPELDQHVVRLPAGRWAAMDPADFEAAYQLEGQGW